jgi:hypothetical protein
VTVVTAFVPLWTMAAAVTLLVLLGAPLVAIAPNSRTYVQRAEAEDAMSTFRAVQARESGPLADVTSELHDAYLDLSGMVIDGGVATFPLARGETRQRWYGDSRWLGESPQWNGRLVIRSVVTIEVEHDQGIGCYSINKVTRDESRRGVEIELNEAAIVSLEVASLDVAIEAAEVRT